MKDPEKSSKVTRMAVEPYGKEACTSKSYNSLLGDGSTTQPMVPDADAVRIVFDQELLREIILGHVIRNESRRGSSRKDLCSIRLVSKEWLQSACKYLHKSREPLYQIILTRQNSLNVSTRVLRNGGKLLDQFTSAMISPTRIENSIPPFRLKISKDFFQEENHHSFSDFLEKCASGLVELVMCIPTYGGSMTYIFSTFNLTIPHLQKLTVLFPVEIPEQDRVQAGENSTSIYLVQSILSGTQELKQLDFPSFYTRAPPGIRYLIFPPTITSINFSGLTKSSQLEVLLRPHNPLPHLTTLRFRIGNQPYSDRLVTKILDKFKSSIRRLIIDGQGTSPDPQRDPTYFVFPKMEKLEWVCIGSQYAELRGGHPPLETRLPKLEQLLLHCQLVSLMEKWTNGNKFSNVTRLSLDLINGSGRLHTFQLPTHFPNVRMLQLFVNGEQTSDLKYVFLEMPELRDLRVRIRKESQSGTVDHWDALFTGIPEELVRGLRRNKDFWPNIQLKEENQLSIRNMKGLEYLTLWCPPSVTDPEESLISELAFRFAFNEMPKLKMLCCGGKFSVSDEMTSEWRAQGRTLEHMTSFY